MSIRENALAPQACSPLLTRRGLLGSAAASIFVAGCDMPGVGASGPAVDASRPVTVGLMVPGGGGNEDLQVVARNLENAARLGLAGLQGVQVDLRVYQTAGDPGRAQALAAQAINDGARILLGPLLATEARAVGPVAAQAGINVLSFSNNPEAAGSNVFLLGAMFETTATLLLAFAAAQGKGRVLVVSEQNEGGQVAERAAQTAAARTGATIVAVQSYAFSQQGIVDALPRIASAARSSGAQSILMTAGSAGALPLLAELLPQNNVSRETYQFMGLTRWDIPPATLQLSGLQGGWFALPDPSFTAAFESRYTAAYGTGPNPIAGLGLDAINVVGALLRRGGSTPFSAEAITLANGFIGASGVFRFRRDGTNERGLAVAEIRNQQRVILSPAPRSFAGGAS